jgi:large subunit ribosomal protein L22
MEVTAESKFVRLSPRKVGLVGNMIVGLKVEIAQDILRNLHKSAAKILLLVLKQGIGNAVNNFKLDKSKLSVKRIEVGKGPIYKRGRAVSRGQSHEILKRTSHITMVIEGEPGVVKKPVAKKGALNGTKS